MIQQNEKIMNDNEGTSASKQAKYKTIAIN